MAKSNVVKMAYGIFAVCKERRVRSAIQYAALDKLVKIIWTAVLNVERGDIALK